VDAIGAHDQIVVGARSIAQADPDPIDLLLDRLDGCSEPDPRSGRSRQKDPLEVTPAKADARPHPPDLVEAHIQEQAATMIQDPLATDHAPVRLGLLVKSEHP
jgi:hypothetical protein